MTSTLPFAYCGSTPAKSNASGSLDTLVLGGQVTVALFVPLDGIGDDVYEQRC
ncbi:MAG: hypothetical protein ACXVZ2_14070 [Gaiellaceae bacterium]